MSFDKLAALYVFCMSYHTGQSSRLYRLMSRIGSQYKLKLTDRAISIIQGDENDPNDEYYESRTIYCQLRLKYA